MFSLPFRATPGILFTDGEKMTWNPQKKRSSNNPTILTFISDGTDNDKGIAFNYTAGIQHFPNTSCR